MAPEQIMASRVDGRADQFSLAVVAYQMLTGKRPFDAPTDQALLFKIVSEEPRPLSEVNALLSQAVSEVIGRGLSKDPERRYPNCVDLMAELTSPGSVGSSGDGGGPAGFAPEPRTMITRHPRGWPRIVAYALLAVAAVAWFGDSIYRRTKVKLKDEQKAVDSVAKPPVPRWISPWAAES
jgi:hypothetical protein